MERPRGVQTWKRAQHSPSSSAASTALLANPRILVRDDTHGTGEGALGSQNRAAFTPLSGERVAAAAGAARKPIPRSALPATTGDASIGIPLLAARLGISGHLKPLFFSVNQQPIPMQMTEGSVAG